MRIRTDSNGFITATGSGLNEYDYTYDGDKDIEQRDPLKNEKAWHWNGGNPEKRSTGNSAPETVEDRVQKLEDATGVNGTGTSGIASRIDDLEQRVSDLESN